MHDNPLNGSVLGTFLAYMMISPSYFYDEYKCGIPISSRNSTSSTSSGPTILVRTTTLLG